MILCAYAPMSDLAGRSSALPASLRAYLEEGGEKNKAERLGALTLLCGLLQKAGLPDMLPLRRDQNGRPYFVGASFDFNLSHSGTVCAAAVSDSRVGIDVQEHSAVLDPLHLSARFFRKSEWSEISSCADPTSAFFTLWTKKEALGKYLGVGLVPILPLNADALAREKGVCFTGKTFVSGTTTYTFTVCAAEAPILP